MEERDPKELLKKIIEGSASDEERAMLESWYFNWRKDEPSGLTEQDHEAAKAAIYSRLPQPAVKQRKLVPWQRIAAAAAVFLIVGVALFFSRSVILNLFQDPGSAQYATDIAPGKQGATLTLASGKVIQLSEAKTGVIVGDDLKYNDNTAVIPATDPSSRTAGRDLLNSSGKRSLGSLEMTAETQSGQTYQFTLPDGTKIWLNAASSLKFPSVFNKDNRVVALTGEAYLEVAKDKAHPFIVETDKQKVEVLGTHFNISSYADESSVKTTLLEGSVRITAGRHLDDRRDLFNSTDKGSLLRRDDEGTSKVLKPNQQAILTNNTIKVLPADTEETVAWKNGYFRFNNESITDIMAKLSRWYNIEVKYGDELPTTGFYGTISRYKNISEVLEMLEQTKGVHFKVEGRRVTVIK